LWGDGSYQFDDEGKLQPWKVDRYRDYRIGIEDDVVKVN